MKNPFIYRGPIRTPEMFFGRLHELQEITAFLRGNQSVSIVGPRKIGKTSLLYHLMRTEIWPSLGMDENNLLVYLDCEVLGNCNHDEIFGTFAAEIAAALEERQLSPEDTLVTVIDQPSRLSFERAIRKLNQRDLRVVLILDEFERMSTNACLDVNFFNALRSAAGRYQFAFITASAQALIQLTYTNRSQDILSSPFFNIFAPQFLGLLSEEDARQAIRQPAEQAGCPFTLKIEDFIYHLVGGYPLGLQVSCFHAFEVLQQSEDQPDFDEIERRTMQELSPHFEYYWLNLTISEQDTLRRLNDVTAHLPSDTTLRGILRDLVQKCLLVSDSGVYRYPMHAWANFVACQESPLLTASQPNGMLTGTQLGPYQVLEHIGRGGMAEVYKGRHPRLERTVAIKVLPARLAVEGDPTRAGFAQRFEREARAIAALRHPNIVQIFDFGDVEGTYYMVMEFIGGQDLSHTLMETGPLNLAFVSQILEQICSALDYAHAQGVVHRDVKPSNVLLERLHENQVPLAQPEHVRAVLTDFGIAKILGGDTAATQTGILMGTLDYMAPEQIRSSGQVDKNADLYALGVMTYQMLTGQLPFLGEHPGAIMLAHLQTPPPDPRLLVPDLPQDVAQAILRALAKDPAARQASAGELAQTIKQATL